MELWNVMDLPVFDMGDDQLPEFQYLPPLTDAELFAADVGAPQFQSPSSSNVPLPEFPIGNQQPLPQPLPLPEFAANVPPPQFAADMCGYQQPQAQPETVWSGDENKEFDMAPHQFQSPSEFQSLPLSQLANVGGNQQPQPQLPAEFPVNLPLPEFPAYVPLPQSAADVCGYQQPQAQPEPFWSEDDNKEFELVLAECLPEALKNRWDDVAACLPGKTPAQIQERFQKLITDINLIHNSYINLHHTSIAPAAPHNMPAPPTTLERNPLSLPGTSEQNQPAMTSERKKTVHWTPEEKELFLRGYKELGRKWKRISEDYVKTRTEKQVVSHAQKVLKKLAEQNRRNNIGDES
ncbi:uncharacterized protein LOC110265393 [Arachis ipaensis]|uniref:uncharacterized protein LOC110265393 n=1 Tax=Arachis ipaensis TaxID=130454 RepID=UPI000A2B49ED|nr:uncharacterized protein LOC110265393 [Arachis ipaensis]